jgi:hypothetical protein
MRSTVSKPKNSYGLCYGDDESAILKSVIDELKGEGRAVRHTMI